MPERLLEICDTFVLKFQSIYSDVGEYGSPESDRPDRLGVLHYRGEREIMVIVSTSLLAPVPVIAQVTLRQKSGLGWSSLRLSDA